MKHLHSLKLVFLVCITILTTQLQASSTMTIPIGGKTILNSIDLALSYAANPAEYTVFTNNDFTLTITNSGADNATGVTVYAPFPSGLAYTSSTTSQGTYSVWTSIWTVGTLASGQSATLDLSLFVLNNTDDISLFAQVQSANETDTDSTPNNNTSQTPIEDDEAEVTITYGSGSTGGGTGGGGGGSGDDVDIELSLSSNHTETNAGQEFSYILSVTNKGPDNATGVKVDFPLPTDFVEFVSSSNDQTTYVPATGLWNIGNLGSNVTRTMLVNVEVIVGGTITATAELTHLNQTDSDSTPDNGVLSEDDMESVDVLGLQIDLELFLELAPGQSSVVPVGSNVTYRLHVENKGPTVGYNTKIRAIMAANVFSYQSSTVSMGYFMDALGVWVIGDIPPFATQTMDITATVLQAGTHTYTCEARTSNVPDVDSTPSNYDPTEDDISSVTISTDGTANVADLSLTASIDDDSTEVGETNTITLTVSNAGPADATGITVEDVMPTGLTFVSAYASEGTYAGNTWTVGDLDNGEFATLELEVTVGTLTSPATYFAQIETASPNDTDSTVGNDSDQTDNEDDEAAVTITQPAIDLELSVTSNISSANIGDAATLTLTVSNIGGADATGVTVEDVFPSELLFISSNADEGTYSSGVWAIGELESGESATLSINTSVGNFTNSIDYFAQVQTASPNNDPDSTPGNDTNQIADEDDEGAISITQPPIDLELSVSSNVLIADVGDDVTLTLTLTNDGPSDAMNIIVEDMLPSGFSLNSSNATHGTYSSDWVVGTLLVGEQANLTLEVTVDAITNSLTYFAQVQTASPDDFDSTPANNSNQLPFEDDEASVTIVPTVAPTDIDLELNISCNVSEYDLYENVTYTITVTNNGPATATGIEVANTLPSGMAFTSKTESQGGFNFWGGVWTVGNLDVGETATLDVVLFVLNNSAAISNFAQVKAANENDSDSTPNNSSGVPTEDDEDAVTIIPAGSNNNDIDLALSKTSNVGTAEEGDAVSFMLTVVNNGTVAATGVTVEDILPSSLTFVSASATVGSYNETTGIWDIGTVGIGGSVSLTINTTVNTIVLPITNFAQVKTANEDDVDSTPDNNSGTTPQEDDEDAITIQPDLSGNFVDLELSKTVDTATAIAGDQVTYTITVTNNGPADATDVTVVDELPAELSFDGFSTSKGAYSVGSSTWAIGNLAENETVTLTIDATVNSITSAITNFAQVTTASPADLDSTPGNDSNQTPDEDDEDSATIILAGSTDIDLEATMTSSGNSVAPWTNVDFTLEVTNNGAAVASGIMADFPVPDGMAFTSKTESQGSYNLWFQTWDIGILQPGETATLVLTLFTLNPGADVIAYAEVIAANETDIDSTPANGNGTSAVEDDEATFTLSNGSSGGKGDLSSSIIGKSSLLTVNRMYPVPTRDFVNVIFTSEAEMIDVVLHDYSGRVLHSHTLEVAQGENTTQVDLSAYPAGWYFVSMQTEEGNVRAKVVKQ